MKKYNYPIGFMQGRLSNKIDNLIQAFPWDDWENEFLLAHENSIQIMEWTLDAKRLYENPIMKKEGRKKIKHLCNKFNLSIPSLTGDCFMQKPFWKSTNSEKLQKDFIEVCKSASSLGIKDIVIPLVDNGRLENSYQYKFLIDFLLSQNDFFIDQQIRILFESEFDPSKLKTFISKFPKDTFGINYDIGNSASLDYNSDEEFLNYGDRILNIHVKDRLKGGNTIALGHGNVDFKKVFKNILNTFYKGNFILQTARAEDNNHVRVILKYKKHIESLLEELSLSKK